MNALWTHIRKVTKLYFKPWVWVLAFAFALAIMMYLDHKYGLFHK